MTSRFQQLFSQLPHEFSINLQSLVVLEKTTTQVLRTIVLNHHSNIFLLPALVSYTPPEDTPLTDEDIAFTDSKKFFDGLVSFTLNILNTFDYNYSVDILKVSDIFPEFWTDPMSPPYIFKDHFSFIITAIRQINLLLYILVVIGYLPFGFDYLNKHYIEIFSPLNLNLDDKEEYGSDFFTNINLSFDKENIRKFWKFQIVVLLDLKTHYYISKVNDFSRLGNYCDIIPSETSQTLLDSIFPDKFFSLLEPDKKCSDINKIPLAEKEFFERATRRKEILLDCNSLKKLNSEYSWEHFVTSFIDYVKAKIGVLICGKKGRYTHPLLPKGQTLKEFKLEQNQLLTKYNDKSEDNNVKIDCKKLELDIPVDTLFKDGTSSLVIANMANSSNLMKISKSPRSLKINTFKVIKPPPPSLANKIPNISNKPSSRSAWSKEEEECLIEGLKTTGPSWTRILNLYGPGGKVNEILKNRNQVQLKDKARNWKLSFLKKKTPLPEYLTKVTGKLPRP